MGGKKKYIYMFGSFTEPFIYKETDRTQTERDFATDRNNVGINRGHSAMKNPSRQ